MITYTQLLNGEWIVRLQADNFGAGTLIWDSEPQGCESKARELALRFRDMLGWGKLSQAQRVNKIIELNRYDKQVQERKAAMERALRQTKQEKPKPSNTQNFMNTNTIAAPGAENPEDSRTAQSSITCVQLPSGKWCVRMRARHGSECLTWDSPPCESELSAQAKAVAIQLKTDWDRQHENQRFNIVLNRIELAKIDAHLNKLKTIAAETTKQEKDTKRGNRDRRYIQKRHNGFRVILEAKKNSHGYSVERGFKTYEEALKWRDDNININEWKSASRAKRRAIVDNLRARRDFFNVSSKTESTPVESEAPSRRGFWARLAARVAAIFPRLSTPAAQSTENKKPQAVNRIAERKQTDLPVGVSVSKASNGRGWRVSFGNFDVKGLNASLCCANATKEEMLRIAWAIIERVHWEWIRGDYEHNRLMIEKVRAIINEYRPTSYGDRH